MTAVAAVTQGAARCFRYGRKWLLCSGNGLDPDPPARARPDRQRHAPRAGPRPGRRGAGRRRGGGAAAGAGGGPGPAVAGRGPGPGRRPRRGGPARGDHLLAQGLHPADPAVPRQVPLLHLRHRARQAAPRGPRDVPLPRRGAGDRPPGRRTGLQGSPVHPRRPTRGPLAARPASGWTRTATTTPSPTSGRWRSGCWRRPGCCRTSTPACCPGRTCSGSSPSRRRWA